MSVTLALATLLSASGPPVLANVSTPGSAQPSRVFTVIVSRYGFNGTASGFKLSVSQGDSVRITFLYGDNDLPYNNPHAIMIDGYAVKSAIIDKASPKATVEFVANVSGIFRFYCFVPCVGMEFLMGTLVVTPTQGPMSPTRVHMAIPVTSQAFLMVSATAEDANGNPLVGVPIRFYENTTFGKLLLGTVATNSEGIAVLNYTVSRTGSIQLIAENQGSSEYASSSTSLFVNIATHPSQHEQETVLVELRQGTQSASRFYGISFPANLAMIAVPTVMNIVIVSLAGTVILAVWSTYGYVFRQLSKLPKYGRTTETEGLMPTPTIAPIEIYAGTTAQEPTFSMKALGSVGLLMVVAGIVDVLLVNSLQFELSWKSIALVAVALLESVAAVLLMNPRNAQAEYS